MTRTFRTAPLESVIPIRLEKKGSGVISGISKFPLTVVISLTRSRAYVRMSFDFSFSPIMYHLCLQRFTKQGWKRMSFSGSVREKPAYVNRNLEESPMAPSTIGRNSRADGTSSTETRSVGMAESFMAELAAQDSRSQFVTARFCFRWPGSM